MLRTRPLNKSGDLLFQRRSRLSEKIKINLKGRQQKDVLSFGMMHVPSTVERQSTALPFAEIPNARPYPDQIIFSELQIRVLLLRDFSSQFLAIVRLPATLQHTLHRVEPKRDLFVVENPLLNISNTLSI